MNKQALVIGGTGFLGAAVVQGLRAADWAVTTLARGRRGNPLKDVPLLIADRTQPGQLAAATRDTDFPLVVDCAAFHEADAAAAVEAFADRVTQYIFISTDFVYARTSDAQFPIPEDAPKQWDLPYAAGKLGCEAVLGRAWQEDRFPVTILRPPHILGAGRALGCDPLTMRQQNLLDRMRTGEELALLAEGQMLIQPVWNREIGACITHLAALEDTERLGGQVFNVAGPDGITTRRYYEIIAEQMGVSLHFRSVTLDDFAEQSPDNAHMARHRLYDLSRLAEVTGYRPQYAVKDAIGETIGWLDAQRAGR